MRISTHASLNNAPPPVPFPPPSSPSPPPTAEHKQRGNDFYKSGDYRSAIHCYTCALTRAHDLLPLDPSLSSVVASYYGNRSAANTMVGKNADALADCDAAIAVDSTFVKSYFRKGKLQLTAGETAAAILSYTMGLTRDPDNAPMRKELEEAKMVAQRLDIALKCSQKVDALVAEGKLGGTDARQAVAQLDIVLGIAPACRLAKVIKASCLAALGRGEEAYALTTQLIRLGGADSDVLLLRSRCLYMMGQMEDVVTILRSLLQGDPDNKSAFTLLKKVRAVTVAKAAADDKYKQKAFAEAADLYGNLLDLVKDNLTYTSKVYYNRGQSYANVRKHAEAIADCTKAIDIDQKYAKAYMRRAASLCMIGGPKEVQDAINDYEHIKEISQDEELLKEAEKKTRSAKVQLKQAKRKDFYKTLGVQRDANENDLKKAYRKLALQFHPDRHAGSTEEEKKVAENMFKEVNLAYEVLSDPKKKELYDSGVDEQDLDDPNAGARHQHGGGGGFGGGGMGGIDPKILFQMFMQQQPGGGGGHGGGGFHF